MPAPAPDPVFRTKREVALGALEKAIRVGRYAPGQSLRQIQLVQDLGVGSTPVREAVLELLARGILVQESHRSVRVAELDLDRLRNIYRVRALLETEAARLGTARISARAIGDMRARLNDMIAAKRKGDSEAAIHADFDFRHLLYAAAENPILLDLIQQSWNLFPGSILWNIPGRIAQSIKEHREIYDAVRRRDPTAAAHAVEKHLLSAFGALEKHVSAFARRSGGAAAARGDDR
ncbi:MAG TPA: GntR family transcriptional regulator [Xanthobacteraceae bacterium]|nr:GntR family transcriptional regulator [Xanthobacteraceae bacterium]